MNDFVAQTGPIYNVACGPHITTIFASLLIYHVLGKLCYFHLYRNGDGLQLLT